MATEPLNQAEFALIVKELKLMASSLYGVIGEQLPDGLDLEADEWMRSGSPWRNPRMEAIGGALAKVVGWYGRLEERLGLEPGEEPKFAHHHEEPSDPRLRELYIWVNTLRVSLLDPLPPDTTGSATDGGPMTSIGKLIGEVMGFFDLTQKQLGLRFGERPKFERFLNGKCQEDAHPVWPTSDGIKDEMLTLLARMAHDQKEKPRDRRAAIVAILDHLHQESSEALLEAIRDDYRRMEPRLAALERKRTG